MIMLQHKDGTLWPYNAFLSKNKNMTMIEVPDEIKEEPKEVIEVVEEVKVEEEPVKIVQKIQKQVQTKGRGK